MPTPGKEQFPRPRYPDVDYYVPASVALLWSLAP